jgi:cold shock CspA family protein
MAQSQSNNTRNLGSHKDLAEFRQHLAESLPRIKGRIRKLKDGKGFGFIAGDDGVDYFFHWTTVTKDSAKDFRVMEIRDRVEFSPVKPPEQDWRAIEVRYVAE